MAAKRISSVYTELRARLDKYEKDLAKARGVTTKSADRMQKRINKISFSKATQSMAKFTRMFNTAALALAGGGALGSLISISTDYENTVFRMSRTFQDETDKMIAKAKEMSNRFKGYYNFTDISYAFTKTADSMQRYGIVGNKYIELVARAAEIGAAKNLELKESIDRIESAMRGEAEASEYLGITLNDTYLKNIAFDGALKDTWETMSDLEKTQHRFNELMIQTAKYEGSATEATNTLSGAWKSFSNTIKDRLAPDIASIGTAIAGVIVKLRDLWAAPKAFTKAQGLKIQQEALLTRKTSLETAIQEIAKSNTPNKQTIIDRMFEKLSLVQQKLKIVSGELYSLEKQVTYKTGGGFGGESDTKTDAAWGKLKSNKKVVPALTDLWATYYDEQTKMAADAASEKARILESIYPESNKKIIPVLTDLWATYNTAEVQAAAKMSAEKAETLRQWEEENKKVFTGMIELTERTAWSMQKTFSDVFFDAMDGKLNSLADYFNAILDGIKRSVADIASQSLIQGLFGNLSKAGGGGGWLSNIFSPDKSMASGGYLGEGVRGFGMKTGQSYEFHPNEVVAPADKLGGGVKVDVKVINNLGQEADVKKTTSWVNPGNMVAEIVLNKKMTSRSFRQGMA